ncbi:MAG: DUF3011 domain-containing protein [Acidobacteriota bacterium]
MKNDHQNRFRILLTGTVLLAMGTAFMVGAQSRRGRDWDDLTQRARQLQRSAQNFYGLLERSRTERGRLAGDARELADESRHFYRSAQRSRRQEHLYDDFEQVRESYLRLRQSLHRRFQVNFIEGQDRWYADVMRAWADTAEHYSELNDYFGGRVRPRPDPRDPMPVPGGRSLTRDIRCKSENYQPNSCFVGGRIQSIDLIDRKSRAACVEGRSFGTQGAYVWVKNGCDGEFRVTYLEDRRD